MNSPANKMAVLFCDGAARGNPGPGAFGFVIFTDNRIVAKEGGRLGYVTNNVAEYHGLVRGLSKCRELGITDITVKSDSELLVRQLNGIYRVRAPGLIELFGEAKQLLSQFVISRVLHIPREENQMADLLANQALDSL